MVTYMSVVLYFLLHTLLQTPQHRRRFNSVVTGDQVQSLTRTFVWQSISDSAQTSVTGNKT